jgi:hypothetical protein
MTLIVEVLTRGECDGSTELATLQELADWINASYLSSSDIDVEDLCDPRNRKHPDRFRELLDAAVLAYTESDAGKDAGITIDDSVVTTGGVDIHLARDPEPSSGNANNWQPEGFSWAAEGTGDGCELWLSVRCLCECRWRVPRMDAADFAALQQQQPTKVVALAVHFSPSRTNIARVPRASRRVGNVFVLEGFDGTVDVTFGVEFSGDPPHLGSATWLLDRDEREFVVPPTEPYVRMPRYHVGPEHLGAPAEAREAYEALLDHYGTMAIEDVIALREHWADDTTGSPHKHQRLHRELLRIERGSLLAPPSMMRDCNRVWRTLVERFWDRAIAYLEDPGRSLEVANPLDPERDELYRSEARVAEEMHDWLTDGRRIGRGALHRSYLRFAIGKGTAFHCFGAPNGANLLCFPELALLLCDPAHSYEHAGGRAFWFDMAMTWCAMCEMALNVYRKKRYRVCSYRAANNPFDDDAIDEYGFTTLPVRPERTYSRKERRDFLRRWRGLAGISPKQFASLLARGKHRQATRRIERLRLEYGRLVLSALGDELKAPRAGLMPLDDFA